MYLRFQYQIVFTEGGFGFGLYLREKLIEVFGFGFYLRITHVFGFGFAGRGFVPVSGQNWIKSKRIGMI